VNTICNQKPVDTGCLSGYIKEILKNKVFFIKLLQIMSTLIRKDFETSTMTDKSHLKAPQEDIHILIVDDDATVRHLMHEFMGTVGYLSHMAASGEDALEILQENTIDVVITDIMMPGMDGLELTERIKQQYSIEIIVMTGYSGDYSYEEVIHKGASDFVFKPVRFEELLLRLKRVLKERNLREELEKKSRELEHLAITDDLTQLFNARYFYRQLQSEIDRSVRYTHSLSLLLLDIDYFKKYNDTYGHLEGNHVLNRIGRIIRLCLRRMDSAYRYGGEEFTVILPETDGAKAETVARRIAQAVSEEKFFPTPEKPAHVTVSVGISEYRKGEDMESFIRRADEAMYQSKVAGRNCVTQHTDSAPCDAVSPKTEQE